MSFRLFALAPNFRQQFPFPHYLIFSSPKSGLLRKALEVLRRGRVPAFRLLPYDNLLRWELRFKLLDNYYTMTKDDGE